MRLRPTIALALSLLVLAPAAAGPAAAQGKSDVTIALAGVSTEVLDLTVNGHFVKHFLLEEDVEPSVTVAARHWDQFTNGAAR
jgi:hypothetical protein